MQIDQSYDNLYNIVKFVPLEEVNNICTVNAEAKRKLCDNLQFWEQRLREDYGITNYDFAGFNIAPDTPISIKYLLYVQKLKDGITQLLKQKLCTNIFLSTVDQNTEYVIKYMNWIGTETMYKLAPDKWPEVQEMYINLLICLAHLSAPKRPAIPSEEQREWFVGLWKLVGNLNVDVPIATIIKAKDDPDPNFRYGGLIPNNRLIPIMTLIETMNDNISRIIVNHLKYDSLNESLYFNAAIIIAASRIKIVDNGMYQGDQQIDGTQNPVRMYHLEEVYRHFLYLGKQYDVQDFYRFYLYELLFFILVSNSSIFVNFLAIALETYPSLGPSLNDFISKVFNDDYRLRKSINILIAMMNDSRIIPYINFDFVTGLRLQGIREVDQQRLATAYQYYKSQPSN